MPNHHNPDFISLFLAFLFDSDVLFKGRNLKRIQRLPTPSCDNKPVIHLVAFNDYPTFPETHAALLCTIIYLSHLNPEVDTVQFINCFRPSSSKDAGEMRAIISIDSTSVQQLGLDSTGQHSVSTSDYQGPPSPTL